MNDDEPSEMIPPEITDDSLAQMNVYRQAFKRFNVGMLGLWRLGFRRWINAWPSVCGRIMVLVHRGRKSGITRRTPVNYFREDDSVYCIAGFGEKTDWYRNVLDNPQVEVWLPDSWWAGTAEDINEHELRDELMRQVLIASGLAAPMFGIDLRKLDQEELAKFTKEYPLLRIQLKEQLSGPGGHGELAWVWAPIVLLLALIAMLIRWWKKR